jgi:glutaredoxin
MASQRAPHTLPLVPAQSCTAAVQHQHSQLAAGSSSTTCTSHTQAATDVLCVHCAALQILRSMNVPFEGVNILADDKLRSGMKEYSQWPTFPQVYVAGEFVGGADIMIRKCTAPLLQ